MLAVFIALFVLGTLLIYYFRVKYSDYEAVYAALLIMSNLYGMGLLVLLLGHGLIKLPIYLWKCQDNTYNLVNRLSRADRLRKAYRSALIEYHEQISICRNLEEQYADGYNRHFFDKLLEEIPEHDLEG